MIPEFRAWDKKQQCYRNGYELYLELEGGSVWELSMKTEHDVIIDATIRDRFVLEQMIDRKDKNKSEIHVGDFVGRPNHYGLIRDINTWEWIKIEFEDGRVKDGKMAMDHIRCLHCLDDVEKCKILGNINENPELLSPKF